MYVIVCYNLTLEFLPKCVDVLYHKIVLIILMELNQPLGTKDENSVGMLEFPWSMVGVLFKGSVRYWILLYSSCFPGIQDTVCSSMQSLPLPSSTLNRILKGTSMLNHRLEALCKCIPAIG